jgi:uncharacterized protein (TIGR03118 family)
MSGIFPNAFVPSPVNPCNSCANDPLYNPPPPPEVNPGCPPCVKNPCPLKSFCDPGLANTCASRPIIDPYGPRRAVTTWKVNYLVANKVGFAQHADADLVAPWGMVLYNNQLYVVINGGDSILSYDLFGNRLFNYINLRNASHNISHPTGIVVNCQTSFPVSNGINVGTSQFLVCSEHGVVCGYDPFVNLQNGYVVLNQQLTGEISVYKGLAIANSTLYLADFFQGRIDVFDATFNRIIGFKFVDNDGTDPIPINYGPLNIVHIGCYLYVLWGERDPNVTIHDLDGAGHGFISVFNLDGTFVRRFASRGVLNSPWAMIPAPAECGFPENSFLVGNNGDGRINIFDCNGKYVGPMLNASGLPITLPGLYALVPHYISFNEIFFTASSNENYNGLLGNIVRDQIIYF